MSRVLVLGGGVGGTLVANLLVRKLHDEIAQLIGEEERAMRREMHADIRQLRAEVAEIRRALRDGAHDKGG